MKLGALFSRFQRLPVHWKVLLGGQAIITVGIVIHRISFIYSANARSKSRALATEEDRTKQA